MNLLYVAAQITRAVLICLRVPLDDNSPIDVLGRHGFLMDWISNSCIPVWLVVGNTKTPVPLLILLGGIPPYIYGDLGGTDRWVWFVLANLLALAAVCPFVGALSDLMGRRYVALAGASFIILGMIVCSTAHTMNTFIGTLPSYSSILTCSQLMFSSWYGVGRCRSRYQRTHSSRCNL